MLIRGLDIINEATIKDDKKIKCLFCGTVVFGKNNMYDHIDDKHSNLIPDGMSAAQFYYNEKNNKKHGKCVICKKPTEWNNVTNKYKRFCENPKCKEIYKEQFKNRMIGKYGKTHLLNDPEQQRKMLENRSISGEYVWSDGSIKKYVGSYELKFLEFLDVMLGFDSKEVLTPAPQTFYYNIPEHQKLDNSKDEYFWIPDLYITSINTIIEIKDGGSNPNTHPNIMKNDKVKEKYKDELMQNQKDFNYIKVTDNDFAGFMKFLLEMKALDEIPSGRNKVNPLVMIQEATVDLLPKLTIHTSSGDEVIDPNYSDLYIVEVDNEYGISFDPDIRRIFVYEHSDKNPSIGVRYKKDITKPAMIYQLPMRVDMAILNRIYVYSVNVMNDKNWLNAFSSSGFENMSIGLVLFLTAAFGIGDRFNTREIVHTEHEVGDILIAELIHRGDYYGISDALMADGTIFKIKAMTKDLSKFNAEALLELAYKNIKTGELSILDVSELIHECKSLGLDDISIIKTEDISFRYSPGYGKTVVTDNISFMKV